MSKRKRSDKKGRSSPRDPRWANRLDSPLARRFVHIGLRLLAGAAVVGGIFAGLRRLDRDVRAEPRFQGPADIVLVAVPDGLEPALRETLDPVADTDWSDPRLCVLIGRRLEANAWVRDVESVRRFPDGRIEARCAYRRPLALVQTPSEFVLIDEECVRLPGKYPYRPSWPLIQGVSSPPPAPGQPWKPPDLAAAVAVLDWVRAESFADQVTAVRVHNYGGRLDARSAHMELATDRAGGRILWGSAPGEEVEENSVEQKLAILRRNDELHGRIDAGRLVIDITTFPDRFTTPTTAAGRGGVADRWDPA